MKRSILIVVLLIGLAVAGFYAFSQTQSLEELRADSAETIAELEASSTQSASDAIASQTALADSAYATYTDAAEDLQNAAATSTQSAMLSNVDYERVAATSTQAARDADDFADSAFATGTALANSADATVIALADSASTQSANLDRETGLGTESANIIGTQSADATSASDAQATLVAQNLTLSGTLEASGWIGDGLFGSSAALPEGFERFRVHDFEIAMPLSWDGADIRTQPRSFFALLDSLGLAEASEFLRTQDENFLFFAIDTNLVNDVPRATVSLLRDTPDTPVSLDDYLGGAYVGLEGNAVLVISDIVPVNGAASARSIVEQTFTDSSVRQMQYVFQVDRSFYILTFTSPESEFAAMRPVLEQIAGTLRLRN
jgi:hypothetical protein